MEILTTITALLGVINSVLSIKDRLTRDEEKQGVSDLLLDISVLLHDIAQDIKSNTYPHAKCGQLHHYLTTISMIFKSMLSEEESTQLIGSLEQAYQVERLFGEIQGCAPGDKAVNLSKLEEVSGSFLAASKTIKLK